MDGTTRMTMSKKAMTTMIKEVTILYSKEDVEEVFECDDCRFGTCCPEKQHVQTLFYAGFIDRFLRGQRYDNGHGLVVPAFVYGVKSGIAGRVCVNDRVLTIEPDYYAESLVMNLKHKMQEFNNRRFLLRKQC